MKIFRMSMTMLILAGLFISEVACAAEIAEVKSPVPYPVNFFWIYIIFGVLVILAGIFLQRLYRALVAKRSTERVRPPAWQAAYQKLDVLIARKLIEKGEYKIFYDTLCDILRWYCEEQFNIKAAEMTTPEFLDSIQRSTVFDKGQQALFRQFLDSCDMVKFAKYAPQASEAQQSYQLARQIIDVSKPQEKAS